MKAQIFFWFLLAALPLFVIAQPQKTIFPECLTGEKFKVLPDITKLPRFRVSLSVGVVFPKDSETRFLSDALVESQVQGGNQEIIMNTGTNDTQRSREKTLGLAFGYQLSRHLELAGCIGYGNSQVSTSIMVLQPPIQWEWPHTEPSVEERALSAEASRWQGMLGAVWHLGRGTLRPMLGAGFHFTQASASSVGYSQGKLGCYSQAGVEIFVSRRVFLNVSGQIRTNAPSMVQGGLGCLLQ